MKQTGPSLDRLIEFQKFLLPFHHIERAIDMTRHIERRESDTEHSFSLALLTWFIAADAPKINTERAIMLAIVHDLVEIYAGDTFPYGEQAMIDSKVERELAALNQIKQEWPDFAGFTEAIEEYEARKTPEAKFVYALDKIQPMFMVILAEGKSWKAKNISLSRIYEEKVDKVALSPEIMPYFEELTSYLTKNSHLFPKK
jgi:putative hydrolase of HD superfamily